MFKNIIRLTLVASLISCNSGKPKQEPVGKNIFAMADSMTAVDSMPAGSVKADEYYADAPVDSTITNYPLDGYDDNPASHKNASILTTGLFHEDEVSKKEAGRSWYGIFQNSAGYYIDTTRIITHRVQDPVEDEGSLNGWEVKTTNSDASLLLFAGGVSGFEKRQIKEVTLRKKEILPGESVTYTYNSITYTLYATGNKRKESATSDYYIVNNYRLFIKATINGTERTQLLVSSRRFDDEMIDILFAGDIDGDYIPDLIIDVSDHYNVTAPALYLSKPAGDKDVFKLMGWHMSVGC